MSLTKEDLERLGGRLRDQYAELARNVERLPGEAKRGTAAVPPDEQLEGDADVVAKQRDTDHRLAEHEARLLDDVEAALARLEAGTYGRCEECERWIARERLEALPSASLCAECESRRG